MEQGFNINKLTSKVESSLENGIPNKENSKTLEYIFRNIVETKAIVVFEEDMKYFGYSEEQILEFHNELEALGKNMEKVLSFPYELRQRMLPRYKELIDSGKGSIKDMVKRVFDVGVKNGSVVAYHCSRFDVPKTKNGNWFIDGKEADHRDNDLPMAYYSFDYGHLYRSKNPKYIYLVSAHTKSTAHKTDGSSWGRAPTIDVIAKLDMREVEEETKRIFEEYKKAAKN